MPLESTNVYSYLYHYGNFGLPCPTKKDFIKAQSIIHFVGNLYAIYKVTFTTYSFYHKIFYANSIPSKYGNLFPFLKISHFKHIPKFIQKSEAMLFHQSLLCNMIYLSMVLH